MFIEDLKLLAKNLRWLPAVAAASKSTDPEFRKRYSELCTIDTLRKFPSAARKFLFGEDFPDHQVLVWYNNDSDPSVEWYYINGILTTQDVEELNLEALSELFSAKITALYNPTQGWFKDIAECVTERTLDSYSEISLELTRRVLNSLRSGKQVRIIAHSQGGIIASTLLKQLQERGGAYNIELFTFASGADEDVAVPGVYQEHFCNEFDFVSRMGLLNEVTSGTVYMQRRSYGHLLNRDYLEHFKSGKYCNGESRLFTYLAQQ